jgi:hypothetical protein
MQQAHTNRYSLAQDPPMPYRTALINGGTGVLRTGSGVVTGQEIIDEARAILSLVTDPARITHGLVDFTAIDGFEASADEMAQVAQVNRKNSQTVKNVLVAIAAPKDIAFGMSRMYGSLIEGSGWEVQTFRTLEQAKAWLSSRLGPTPHR